MQNIAFAINAVAWLSIAVLMLSDQLFGAIGMPTPEVIQQFSDNKIMVAITIFFLARTVTTNMMATGAFEVSLDGDLIFSKLEVGHPPSWKELAQILFQKGVVE